MLSGTKDAKARKDCQKAMMAFRRVVFRTYQPDKDAVKDYSQNKSKGKFQKRKGIEADFQPLKHLKKKDIAMPGNLMTGLPVSGLQRFQKNSWFYGRATEFCHSNSSFVFANSETQTCSESCIIHFPTTPPCSTMVDVLETGIVPILFSLPQMRNLGMTLELDPQGDKITCPAFGLFSSPAEYSTMGHIVLDLTSLTYQPTTQSSNPSGHSKKYVIFAMSERKPSICGSSSRPA